MAGQLKFRLATPGRAGKLWREHAIRRRIFLPLPEITALKRSA
jgi:hypothetical protein